MLQGMDRELVRFDRDFRRSAVALKDVYMFYCALPISWGVLERLHTANVEAQSNCNLNCDRDHVMHKSDVTSDRAFHASFYSSDLKY